MRSIALSQREKNMLFFYKLAEFNNIRASEIPRPWTTQQWGDCWLGGEPTNLATVCHQKAKPDDHRRFYSTVLYCTVLTAILRCESRAWRCYFVDLLCRRSIWARSGVQRELGCWVFGVEYVPTVLYCPVLCCRNEIVNVECSCDQHALVLVRFQYWLSNPAKIYPGAGAAYDGTVHWFDLSYHQVQWKHQYHWRQNITSTLNIFLPCVSA